MRIRLLTQLLAATILVSSSAWGADRRPTAPPSHAPTAANIGAANATRLTPPTGRMRERAVVRRPDQIASPNYDIDGNILNLPTKWWLVDPKTGKEHGVVSTEPALVRTKFDHPTPDGKALQGEGPYARYVATLDPRTGTFRDFRTDSAFLKDVKAAVKEPTRKWQGPRWKEFKAAMDNPSTARRATFITARGQSPKAIHDGFVYLQKKGFIRYVPPKENFFPVASEKVTIGGKPLSGDTATKKTVVMRAELDELQTNGFGRTAKAVLTPDGASQRVMHTWEFSDDTYENYAKAVEALSADVKTGRWPDVKITVVYTGHDPAHKREAVVLRPDGTTRPQLPSELHE